LVCAAGVTGSTLTRRIETIMRRQTCRPLTVWQKCLITATAIVTIAAPVVEGALNPIPGQAPSSAANRVAFEVASDRQNTSAGPSNLSFAAGGRFTARNTSLRMLIRIAYRIQDFQLVGQQGLLDNHFDVVAKAEGNPPVRELQSMLRTLLADRL